MILDKVGRKCVIYRLGNTHGTRNTSIVTETDEQRGTDVRKCVLILLSQEWTNLNACSSIFYDDDFCNADRRRNDHISIKDSVNFQYCSTALPVLCTHLSARRRHFDAYI